MSEVKLQTKIRDIVSYWETRANECDMGCDFDEANKRCWACGILGKPRDPSHLERCHIIPRSLGGEDIPSNYVILCRNCHMEAPDVVDPSVMWEFIKKKSYDYKDGEHSVAYYFRMIHKLMEESKLVIPENREDLPFNTEDIVKNNTDKSVLVGGKFTPATREWIFKTTINDIKNAIRTEYIPF
jgi:HNH endonuclease